MAALTVNTKPNTQTIGIAKGPTPMFPTKTQLQKPASIPRATPTYNPQPRTYNPQPAYRSPIQGTGSSNYPRVTAQQLIAEAARQADLARIAAIEHKKVLHRLLEAKIGKKQKGIFAGISRFIGLSGFTKQRAARERAIKFLGLNNEEAALYIQAKQREFEREKAARQAWLIKQQNNPNFGKLLDQANAWAKSQSQAVAALSKDYGATQKSLYKFAGSPVKGTASKILGGGFKVASKVLAPVGKAWNAFTWAASQPARGVNTAINFVNPNRLRTYYGGQEKSGGLVGGSNFNQLKKAYTASANQRLIGLSRADEAARLRGGGWRNQAGVTKYYDDLLNLLADPINVLPVGWASKLSKASRLSKVFNLTKGKFALPELPKSKIGRFLKYATGESKSPGQQLSEAIDLAKTKQFHAQQILPRINALNKRLSGKMRLDTSVFDDFRRLGNDEARILQRMVAGRLSRRDRLYLIGSKNKIIREHLEKTALKWQNFTEQMRLADRVITTSYGAGKKTYSPRTAWAKGDLSRYNFRLFRRPGIQSKTDFMQGAIDRYFKSELDTRFAKTSNKRLAGARAEKARLLSRYQETMANARRGVEEAQALSDSKLYKAGRVLGSPLRLWKKSVLKYRPAWYVNNALWNIPASVSAGGVKAIPEMAKMAFSRNYRAKVEDITAPAKSAIASEIGGDKAARLGSAIENIPRSAAYKALIDRGVPPDKALKRVNDWLFDYSNKRFEQPIRQVLPFYNWSKGLTKLAVKMPFTYPRHAGFYAKLYQQFYQQPLDKLDNTTKTWTDEKGQVHTSNERQKYEGKLKVWTDKSGKEHWSNTPFYALTPAQLGQINMNPLLVLGKLVSSNRDRYGNLTTDRNILQLSGEQFPQFSLGKKFLNRGKANFERWFSKSGYSKESQGQDPSMTNYNQSADSHLAFNKALSAFLGKPNTIIRDPKAAAYNKRYTDFNTAYFQVDWDKRITDLLAKDPESAYDKWNAEKQALAQKYGFDFKKDIIHGGWQKYDTYTSKQTKAYKEAAAAFMDDYWKQYAKLPKPKFIKTATGGYWTPSTARPFWIAKFKEWRIKDTFSKNPYYSLPYYNVKDKAGNKTGARSYINPYELQQKEAQSQARRAAGLARYAAGKHKYALWQQYWKLPKGEQRRAFLRAHPELLAGRKQFTYGHYPSRYRYGSHSSPYQYKGHFFKSAKTMDRYKAGEAKHKRFLFFQKYFAASTADKIKLMAANPQYNQFGDPNKIGFDKFRANKTAIGRAKARKLAGFSSLEAKLLREINLRTTTHPLISRNKKLAFKIK